MAPYLCIEGDQVFLADPQSQKQLKIPSHHATVEGGLAIKKLQDPQGERFYILDAVNPTDRFRPRYVHALMKSTKATEWTCLAWTTD